VAILHDKNKKPELAVPFYQQAIAADPTNMVAQYNLGIYFNNKAADLYNKVNKMSMAEYGKSGKKIEAEAKVQSQKAVPYLEAALKLNPDDQDVMYSLSKIYMNLGRNADAEKMNKMMDAAKGKTPKKK
jgi:tetratricopeptide (TPR) repeat protein